MAALQARFQNKPHFNSLWSEQRLNIQLKGPYLIMFSVWLSMLNFTLKNCNIALAFQYSLVEGNSRFSTLELVQHCTFRPLVTDTVILNIQVFLKWLPHPLSVTEYQALKVKDMQLHCQENIQRNKTIKVTKCALQFSCCTTAIKFK